MNDTEKMNEAKPSAAKLVACNERSRARIAEIAHLANECLLNTNHPNGYEQGQFGKDYRTYGRAMCEIRKLIRESVADVAPDYEMLALQFARNSFDFAKFQEALAAVASMKAEDFPGVYYTPGWLCELAKKLEAGDVHGLHGLHGLNPDPNPCKSVKSVDEADSQSALQREEARQKRKIHWTAYPTKVDVCVMGKTEQNGKVYEVRISKRQAAKIDDTYAQCKVNGKGVLTCNFTGNAWMLKRILTAGMQALVNYKAKKNRDRRRNYAKRAAAAKQQAHDNKAENGGQA